MRESSTVTCITNAGFTVEVTGSEPDEGCGTGSAAAASAASGFPYSTPLTSTDCRPFPVRTRMSSLASGGNVLGWHKSSVNASANGAVISVEFVEKAASTWGNTKPKGSAGS